MPDDLHRLPPETADPETAPVPAQPIPLDDLLGTQPPSSGHSPMSSDIDGDDDAPARGLLGKTIKNRYTLWEVIGAGLQAQAFLAYDNLLEGKVVVKVLSTEIEGIPLPLHEGWEQEAKKAMLVRNCPYIASVTDFGLETISTDEGPRDVAFIVWEYVRGATLEDLTRIAGELTLEFLLELSQQLLQVLRILQANGLIHGDLHSKNVMVDKESSGKTLIKVIDFGLAHAQDGARNAFRDLRSVQRMLLHLAAQRQQQLGPAHMTARDQEFAAIVEQIGVSGEDISEVVSRAQQALEHLARRHLATVVALNEYETLDELLPWSSTFLANVPLNRTVACVGRQEQIQQLVGHLDTVFSEGHGATLLVRGESGVGKKRLVWEALHEFCMARRELFLLIGRGHRGQESQPFALIRDLLRNFLGEGREAEYPRLLTALLPDGQPLVGPLSDFLQEDRPGVAKAPELPVASLAHLVGKALAKMSLIRPVILWVSDLQFADEASRLCLQQITLHTQRFPMAIIGTFSPGEFTVSGGQQALFESWYTQIAGTGNFMEITLRVLSRQGVCDFLQEALPWRNLDIDHPLVNALWQHSGGNPHYLQESLAYLKQSGIVESDTEDGWIVDTGALMEVGATSIQLLLERRVQQLDPLTREVLETAACWGVEFSEAGVAALFHERATEVAHAIKTAQAQGLLTQVKPGMVSFQPYALWELIDRGLPADRRQRYHCQVAEYMQGNSGDPEENEQNALLIAKHWEEGGDPLQALEYSLLAAEWALNSRANELALEACRRAQQLLSGRAKIHPQAVKLTAQCYLHQAKAYRYLGDQAAQEEYAYKAYETAVISRNPAIELRALKALGEYYRSVADYEASTDYFRQGMEIAEESGDRARIGRFHKEIGVNHYLQGELDQAQSDYQRAIDINEEISDIEGLARVYNNLGIIHWKRSDWPQAKEFFERSIAYFQEAGETQELVRPMGNMAIIYTEEGEYEKAMILLKELLKNEKQLGESRLQAKVRVTLGDVQFEIGQHDEALENYEHSLTVYRALGDRQGECEVLTNIASVYYEEGKLDLADRFHQMAMSLKSEIGYEWGMVYDHYDLARVALDRGDPTAAHAQAKIGKTIAAKLNNKEMEFCFNVLETRALLLERGGPDKEIAKRFDGLCEQYPEVKANMTKQRQLFFLVHTARFYRAYGEITTADTFLTDAQDLVRKLERKLFRREHKVKFRAKFQRLFPELSLPSA